MNKMQRYDNALMEGVSPKRLAKKRMKAFIEAASEIAPRAIVEAVVTAHKALFEFGSGRTPNGVRYVTGTFSSDPRKTNNWGTQTVFNGNDLVATNSRVKPPTSGGTNWHKQTNTGTAAYRTYDDVHTYQTRQRIDPRGYGPSYNVRMDDPWERKSYYEVPQPQQPPPPPPPKPVQQPAPQAVRQQAPQPAPKQECPPVCKEPAPAPAPKQADENRSTKTVQQAPEQPKKTKPKASYKWNENDFHPIREEGCDPTHDFTINLVSYNKDDRDSAMAKARFLAQTKNIPGVYTYQYNGLAQNTTREDVWRVRIGFFKSKAAARTYFIKYVRPIVGDQFHWWVGTCSGDKGDKAKKGTFMLGKDITKNDCVDTSVATKGSEQPQQNDAGTKEAQNAQQGSEKQAQTTVQTQATPQTSNTAPQQGASVEVGDKPIMDLVYGK